MKRAEPKRPKHHYIPVFYLHQWTASDGRVTAFKRHYGDKVVATPKPPTHTGYVRGLYWLEGAGPEIGNRLETIIMGNMDSNAAIAHRHILDDDLDGLPMIARIAWSRFLVGLLIRSPAKVANIYRRMVTPGTKEFKEISREFRRDFPNRHYRDVPSEVMKRAALLTLAKLCQNFEVEDLIRNMRWTVYDLGLPELCFFTSDRPIMMSNGLAKKGGYLAIPVSPRKLFLAFANSEIEAHFKSQSPWHIVDDVNLAVVQNAVEFVWDISNVRLPFVQTNLSINAENDRNFFALSK